MTSFLCLQDSFTFVCKKCEQCLSTEELFCPRRPYWAAMYGLPPLPIQQSRILKFRLIYHETHRSRILFAAHIAKNFIEQLPELRLTLDISHWCNVHESLLQDQQATVQLALDRTDHIHARVGHAESPQITDPRAPEWENEVKAHFAWWDYVVKKKVDAGQPLTVTTEFGPPNYMAALPYTRQPIANLWEVNAHMLQLWRQRYA